VWSLFADSNQTASLRDVAYQGRTFQLTNHFFPLKTSLIKKWGISDSDIARSLKQDDEDRFVAKWLAGQKLDAQCKALLEMALAVYKSFFKNFKDLPTATYKIQHWDAGWWQIKKSLVEAGFEKDRFAEIEDLKKEIGLKINAEAMSLGIVSSA
jgi:hypothetical protein